MAADRGWLRAGAVGSPHGLDGSFYVNQPNAQLLVLDATVIVGGQAMRITRRAGTDLRPIVRLAGHEDRNAASALRGQELLAPRSEAPELGPEEWWVEDLEGCTVRDSGRALGTVRRVLALPSCEVLEVVLADGGGELLVPLVSDAVQTVDIERREILVDVQFLRDG
jgi:16S rRNA processing protein RimM